MFWNCIFRFMKVKAFWNYYLLKSLLHILSLVLELFRVAKCGSCSLKTDWVMAKIVFIIITIIFTIIIIITIITVIIDWYFIDLFLLKTWRSYLEKWPTYGHFGKFHHYCHYHYYHPHHRHIHHHHCYHHLGVI